MPPLKHGRSYPLAARPNFPEEARPEETGEREREYGRHEKAGEGDVADVA